MSLRPRRLSSLVVAVLCAAALYVLFLPAVASAQSSGGVGSASGAAGRYIDPGMNAGASMGATTTVSGGFPASTGTATGFTTTSGGTGTTTGDGDVGWRPVLLVLGGVFLVYFLAGRGMRLIGAAAGTVRRRRGR
ncbi:hypothetical protein DMB38_13525 [Streptomyces sp. WAC 06738]|nr:hypothetical protein DMB38_13525 [Streptomyces sp. WAC 06738]